MFYGVWNKFTITITLMLHIYVVVVLVCRYRRVICFHHLLILINVVVVVIISWWFVDRCHRRYRSCLSIIVVVVVDHLSLFHLSCRWQKKCVSRVFLRQPRLFVITYLVVIVVLNDRSSSSSCSRRSSLWWLFFHCFICHVDGNRNVLVESIFFTTTKIVCNYVPCRHRSFEWS